MNSSRFYEIYNLLIKVKSTSAPSILHDFLASLVLPPFVYKKEWAVSHNRQGSPHLEYQHYTQRLYTKSLVYHPSF